MPESLAPRGSSASRPAVNLDSAMIHEVDEALRRLVLRDAVDGTGVELSFEAPTKEWAARRNAPTVDVYLYDLREDVERRDQ